MNEGQVIGNYVVGREIGRGGMGVVHFATDSRLGRPVAIKALPEHLIADRERLARFDREARTLASISHPNIAGIYGVEEHEGRKYLVLEYVEGETLADRLDRGRLKVEDAIETCAQVAAGVEAAHEAGVVHRDLKPGNVKITPDGRVKVLDFGLAKTTEASSGASADGETVPLDRRTETVPGAVLGTAPYMSPEQARGRKVDQRSDVWSFGAVLYECLTGAGPFSGETVTDTLGAILHKDPDWSRLPKETPPTVQLLLRRCLQRDRTKRLHSIGDARIELEAAMEDPSGSALLLAGQALSGKRKGAPWLLAIGGAAATLAIGALAGWMLRSRDGQVAAHLGVPLPEGVTELTDFDLSPDGRTIAIVGAGSPAPDGAPGSAIYVRQVTDREFTELAGTKDAGLVRFSPGGSRICFIRRDQASGVVEIASVPRAGGPALTLYRGGQSDVLLPFVVSPLGEDSMLVASRDARGLFRLSASGGPPRDLGVKLPEGRFVWEIAPARQPFALVSTISLEGLTSSAKATLCRVNLDTGETEVLLEDVGAPAVVDAGALVFLRGETLFTAPFDLDRALITGPVRAVVSNVASFAVARSAGHLAYLPKGAGTGHGLVAFDRSGASENILESKKELYGPVVSPDDRRIAYGQVSADYIPSVWVLDVASRLARVISKGEVAFRPCWTPDGRLAYVRPIDGKRMQLVVVDPSLNTATPLFGADNVNEVSYSPDGRHMILACDPGDGREPGLYQAESEHPETIRAFFASPAWDGYSAFSPDGKWVAYITSGSGRMEVYLRAFDPVNAESAPIHPVSREGGQYPVWSRDGKELFFVGGPKSDGLFGATIETEPALKIGEPRRILNEAVNGEFDVLPDGRFIFARKPSGAEARPDLRIILNWAQSQGERESQ